MNKLRRLRVIFGGIILFLATLLFLDFTGVIHRYFGWVAKIQFLPALLGLHVIIIVALLVLTLIFGRLYCSVICPLGLFQDSVSRVASALNKKRKFSPSAPKTILRWSVFALFVVALIAGVGSLVALLDPYGAFGRIISTIFAPIYKVGNNALAAWAESVDSYAFYSVDVVVASLGMIAISVISLVTVGFLAWRGGRTYCNTICPVGTLLGFFARFSLLKITIDESKCNGCRKCTRQCKTSCIDIPSHSIDHSRCVSCFDCIDSCNQGAISYTRRRKKSEPTKPVDNTKRTMLTVGSALLTTTALKAEGKLFDGGLAFIEGKKASERETSIVPPGAQSHRNFAQKCVGCQLCVTVCPNGVLRPSTSLLTFMQPEASFEKGFCRPECTKCSEVCPSGAIMPIDLATKSSTQIGHAVLIRENCVVLTDGVECGNCATRCPSGAIQMIEANDTQKYGSRKIPVVDAERCIGCGACEHLCPAHPFSAIYVEGHKEHRTI